MTNPDETNLVLPIICPSCSHEIELSMLFELLPPKEKKGEDKINEAIVEE
jgi:hypothetical protein